MADYLGDFVAGETVVLWWNTNAIAGESITRATDGSIRIYKDNSDTQRNTSAGITDTEDADTLTGVHRLVIDLSDNTDASFYAAGSDYTVVLVAATIDGKVINHALGQFSIENRAMNTAAAVRAALGMSSANLDTQLADLPTNAELATALASADDAVLAAVATVDSNVDSILVDTVDIQSRLPAALVSGRMDSSVGAMAANTLTASALATDAVTEIQSGLATAAALTTVDSVVDDILLDTAVIGAAGAGLTAIPYNAAWDAEIQSEVTDALNAYDPPTNAELTTALAAADDAVLARLGTPAGASIAADIAAIETQTDDIGANGAGLTAVPWNAAWDAEVQSEVADALNAYDPPTNAEMVARTILAADYFVTGDYTAPDNAGITAIGIDVDAVGSLATAIKAVTDLFTFTSGAVDANVERINGDATAAANLAISAATMISGTAQAGTLSSTQMSTNLSSSTNNAYVGRTVIFTSGALQYQAAAVEAYNGATKVITFSQRTGAPQAGDGFVLV